VRYPLAAASLAALVLLVLPASAQVPGDALRVDPDKAGAASHVLLDVRSSEDPQANGESPQQAFINFAAGAKFDPNARAATCSAAQAKEFNCPADSKIGDGTADATVTTDTGVFVQNVQADVQIFLGPPQQSGDVGAVVAQFREPQSNQRGTTTGRIVKVAAPYGLGLRFEDLSSAAAAPQGFRVKVNRLRTDVGAFRIVKKKAYKTVRRNGKKRKVKYYKKVRVDLIRNPKSCSGSWPYQVRLVYPGGRESVRDGTIGCTP
jgi:hypothetical protein